MTLFTVTPRLQWHFWHVPNECFCLQWQSGYSDTFTMSRGCHCKRGPLYSQRFTNLAILAQAHKIRCWNIAKITVNALIVMFQWVLFLLLLFATLREDVWASTPWGPTQAPALRVRNVYADRMTFVQKLPVVRGRGTVMMTQNVKDHLFVDTWIAWTVQ